MADEVDKHRVERANERVTDALARKLEKDVEGKEEEGRGGEGGETGHRRSDRS